jgi:hypothetical protein
MVDCMNGDMEEFWKKVQAAMGRERVRKKSKC